MGSGHQYSSIWSQGWEQPLYSILPGHVRCWRIPRAHSELLFPWGIHSLPAPSPNSGLSLLCFHYHQNTWIISSFSTPLHFDGSSFTGQILRNYSLSVFGEGDDLCIDIHMKASTWSVPFCAFFFWYNGYRKAVGTEQTFKWTLGSYPRDRIPGTWAGRSFVPRFDIYKITPNELIRRVLCSGWIEIYLETSISCLITTLFIVSTLWMNVHCAFWNYPVNSIVRFLY